MPEIQVRPAIPSDLNALLALDHTSQTDYVWQMDVQNIDGQIGAIFREIRLPRTVTVPYPRPVSELSESWNHRSGVLVAVVGGQPVGFVRTNDVIAPHTAWILDLVVASRYRRQGIASALILEAQSWALQRKNYRIVLEMASKNHPAIRLAQKLGYEFCGYNDQYYETQDIAIFFGSLIR
jgi:ribosomal protein S18 acetylase RimI-like enzyme